MFLQRRSSALKDEHSAFFFFNVLDALLTIVVLLFGGGEANPFARWIIEHYGIYAFLIIKFILVGFASLTCEVLHYLHTTAARLVLWLGILLYFSVVLWECLLIITLGTFHLSA